MLCDATSMECNPICNPSEDFAAFEVPGQRESLGCILVELRIPNAFLRWRHLQQPDTCAVGSGGLMPTHKHRSRPLLVALRPRGGDHTGMTDPSRSDAGGIVEGMGSDSYQPVSDLTGRLDDIESQLDDGTYQAGPWADLLRAAQRRDQAERRSMTDDVSRVSDKLHHRNHPVTLPLSVGLLIELLGTAVGLIALEIGLRRSRPGWVLAAGMILTVTWQPLLRVAAGYLMGIRYSYCFLRGVEPRVKMQYGTYLAATQWRRVTLHLAGTVGSPLAFCWVAVHAAEDLPDVAKICWLLCWTLVAVQVVMFIVVLAGARRHGPLGGAHLSSGGSVARELRSAARH